MGNTKNSSTVVLTTCRLIIYSIEFEPRVQSLWGENKNRTTLEFLKINWKNKQKNTSLSKYSFIIFCAVGFKWFSTISENTQQLFNYFLGWILNSNKANDNSHIAVKKVGKFSVLGGNYNCEGKKWKVKVKAIRDNGIRLVRASFIF